MWWNCVRYVKQSFESHQIKSNNFRFPSHSLSACRSLCLSISRCLCPFYSHEWTFNYTLQIKSKKNNNDRIHSVLKMDFFPSGDTIDATNVRQFKHDLHKRTSSERFYVAISNWFSIWAPLSITFFRAISEFFQCDLLLRANVAYKQPCCYNTYIGKMSSWFHFLATIAPEKLSQPFFVVFDGNIEQQTPIRIIESMVVRDSNISIHSRSQYSIAECLLSHRNHIHTMERVRERATDVCGVNKRQMCW